jgi:hypothetical protein
MVESHVRGRNDQSRKGGAFAQSIALLTGRKGGEGRG